jgi:hypothetical protein
MAVVLLVWYDDARAWEEGADPKAAMVGSRGGPSRQKGKAKMLNDFSSQAAAVWERRF